MCFSTVYLGNKSEGNLVLEDVSRVRVSDGSIQVSSILGDDKSFEGYSIDEVNLMENYVILKERADA
jgi:predicted RNA-binding protein